MKISTYLDRQDVTVEVPVGNKEQVLASLVELLAGNHPEFSRDQLLQILLKREQLRSTGIEDGVAFPHGRVPGLGELVACFGICRPGVDFQSFDGKPTHFFFVLLIPERAQGSHLKALARLNRLFQERAFRERLLAARDAEEAYRLVVEEDEKR